MTMPYTRISSPSSRAKPLERIMIFIDGGYLRKLFNDLLGNDSIDLSKVIRDLITWYNYDFPQNLFQANLVRTYYYDGIVDSQVDPEAYAKQRKYFDNIAKTFNLDVSLGEAVKLKNGKFRQKGVDIILAIDSLTMAYQDQFVSGLFLLGDRDFIPLINGVKDTGKKTYGFFFGNKVSDELITSFDFRKTFDKKIMDRWVQT